MPVLDRVVRGDGCWEWAGAHSGNGYAMVWFEGRVQGAHRVVYRLLAGEFDPALTIDHLCRNRGCVNPAHMEPVPIRENVRRAAARDTCKRGHPRTPENTSKSRNCKTCQALARKRKEQDA